MKKYLYSLIVMIPAVFLGQVGIKTTNPQQGLHVGGATSTVKIDGLSYPTNPNNLGPGSSSRVFVDANGDLVLGTAQNNLAILFDAEISSKSAQKILGHADYKTTMEIYTHISTKREQTDTEKLNDFLKNY